MSWRWVLLSFGLSLSLAMLLFWGYLNLQLKMQIASQHASIQLPQALPLNIQLNRYFSTQVQGDVQADVALKQDWLMPLKGRYSSEVNFAITTPIQINVDYHTDILIKQVIDLQSETKAWSNSRLLPNQTLKLRLPIEFRIPIHYQKRYDIPLNIDFRGPVLLDFNEHIQVHLAQRFQPILPLNDAIQTQHIAAFQGQMLRPMQSTPIKMQFQLAVPLQALKPTAK